MFEHRNISKRKGSPTLISDIFKLYQKPASTGSHHYKMAQIVNLKGLWRKCAGDKIASYTAPYRFNNGILFITVYDSMWLTDLSYLKLSLLERLTSEGLEVEDIRFTLSKIVIKQTKPKVSRRVPTSGELNWAEKLSSSIKSDKLRVAFNKCLLSYLSRVSIDKRKLK